MADYAPGHFEDLIAVEGPSASGFYRVYYGGEDSAWEPDGPYPENDRCLYDDAGDYPRDGYIVWVDDQGNATSVPSLPGLD